MHRHIPSAADFMNAAPYSPAPGLSYGAPQQQLGAGARGVGAPKGFSALDSFEATSFLDAGLGTEDFFSPFLNPDFPIDISLPLQHLGDNVMQSQAPLMQVAQSQGAGVRRNPKLAAKRKLEAAAKARQPQAQQQQAQAQVQQLLPMQQQQAQAQQGKTPLMPMAPAPQSTTSASMRPSSSLSMSSQSLYVDSPPSGGCGDQGEDDYYGGEEPTNKRQKRLVKNRQAAQLFRKRQKQYISDLENKVAEVTNKNIALMAKVDVLVTENQLVKDQLKYLRTFVVSALEQAFPQQKYAEMQQQLGDIGLHDGPKKEQDSSAPAPAPATAANPTIISSSPSSSPAPSSEER